MKVIVSKKDGSESILINHIMGDGFKNLVPFSSDDSGAIRIATSKGFQKDSADKDNDHN
jgi:hypothetical protein